MSRTEAIGAIRARWSAALSGAGVVYANWKPDDEAARPSPGSATPYVEEVYEGESSEDAGIGRATRWRRRNASLTLRVHIAKDSGVKPALDLIDAIERALVTGSDITLSDGTPVLIYDTVIGSPRDDEPWYMVPLVLFYTYTVGLTAA